MITVTSMHREGIEVNALHRVVLDTSTLVSAADVLISSDADLRVLHPWRGIPIITPQDYLLSNE